MNRENWEVKKLGEVCEITNGRNQKKVVDPNGIYPIMGSGGIMGYANDFLCPIDTVIIGRKGTINKPLFVKDNVWIVDTAFGIVANNSILNSSFLFYFCKFFDFNKLNVAVTIPSLRKIDLKEIPILIPPLPIQEAIVKELNTLHRLKELQEQQLAEYDNLAQTTFYSMFGDPIENDRGWEVKKLGEVCVINPKKSEIKDLDGNTDISFVPMADVSENGSLHLKETKKLNEVWSGFTYFKNNDVLFAKITPCMENGKRTIAKNLINNIGFGSTEFHVLRPKQDVISDFIFYILSLDAFRKIAERNMTGSAGQKRVPKNILDSFEISIPPLPLQSQFADRIEKIEKQKELIKQSITQTQMLIDYTMDKYFN